MKSLNTTGFRRNIYNIIRDVVKTSEPVQILSKHGDTVLISKDDWSAIQETLYLLSIPGMREKLEKGAETPLDECVDEEELGWDLSTD